MLSNSTFDLKYLLPWLVLLSLAFMVKEPEQVVANEASCAIKSFKAKGEAGNLPILTIYKGSGLNISFIPVSQKLKKVWLDDPSQVTVDFDAPLEKGASVIHLKRINPLNFSQLPKSDRTLLTVITTSPQGQQSRYQFRLTYGNAGKPSCYGISVVPDPVASVASVSYLPVELESNLMSGLAIAKSRGLISSLQGNLVLERRVKQYISLRKQGMDEELAQTRAKISQGFLDRLQELADSAVQEPPDEQEIVCDQDAFKLLECLLID
ncbi:hypothetical protein [Aphanothece hegewaldii]|nr:hypothetical protein [Aphanothece hegewaldii]